MVGGCSGVDEGASAAVKYQDPVGAATARERSEKARLRVLVVHP